MGRNNATVVQQCVCCDLDSPDGERLNSDQCGLLNLNKGQSKSRSLYNIHPFGNIQNRVCLKIFYWTFDCFNLYICTTLNFCK